VVATAAMRSSRVSRNRHAALFDDRSTRANGTTCRRRHGSPARTRARKWQGRFRRKYLDIHRSRRNGGRIRQVFFCSKIRVITVETLNLEKGWGVIGT
jgi:hypothetical protein